jgi:hypothetical protein
MDQIRPAVGWRAIMLTSGFSGRGRSIVGTSILRKLVFGLLLAVAAMTACTEPEARPERLSGEEPHSRHATGIDSQVGDK